MATIPAIFIEENYAEISLVENLLRQDLTAVEEAEALKGLMDGQKYTQEQLSAMIGKATSTISEILSLNKLPQEVRDECRSDPAISKNILIEIAKSKQQRGMLSLYKKYKTQKLSKEQIKQQRKREVKPPSEAVLTVMTDLTEKIGKLDITQLTDADMESLREALSTLTQAIEEKLSGATQTEPKPAV
jgi:ParB family chromosome partitioning protein